MLKVASAALASTVEIVCMEKSLAIHIINSISKIIYILSTVYYLYIILITIMMANI